jgi:hypothetical protein
MVEEGLALYGFIRSLPVDITIHNIGSIDSHRIGSLSRCRSAERQSRCDVLDARLLFSPACSRQ